MALPNASHEEGCLVQAKRAIIPIHGTATFHPEAANLPDRCVYSTKPCRSHGIMWPFVVEQRERD